MAAALGPTALGRFLWAAFQSLWAFWGGVGDFRSVKRRLRGGIRGASRDVRSAKWRHEGVRSAGGCEGGRTKWRRFGDQNGGRGGVSSGVGGRGDPHPEAATAELRPGEGRSVRPAPEGAVRAPPCPRRCAGGGCCCWGSPGGGTGCAEPPPPPSPSSPFAVRPPSPSLRPQPHFAERLRLFERLKADREQRDGGGHGSGPAEGTPIRIALPGGRVLPGLALRSTPRHVAEQLGYGPAPPSPLFGRPLRLPTPRAVPAGSARRWWRG